MSGLHSLNQFDLASNLDLRNNNQINLEHDVKTLSKNQKRDVYKFFKELSNKNFKNSNKIATKLNIKIIKKIQIWQQIVHLDTANLKFEQVLDFIISNQKWPDRSLMIANAEYFIKKNTNPEIICAWFAKYRPNTQQAALLHIKLLKKYRNQNTKYITQLVKSYCIDYDIEEQKSFGIVLSKEDYLQKVNNYLWQGQISLAQKYLHLIDKNYQKNIVLFQKISRDKKFTKTLISQIDPNYLLSSLVYHYLNTYKNHISDYQEVIMLLKIVSADKDKIDEFSKLQSFFIREFLFKKQYLNAYKIASNNYMQTKINSSENEFLAGWIALNFLKKPKLALQHFFKFDHIVITYTSKAKGYYWIARAYEELNLKNHASIHFAKSANHSLNFYGQASARKLDRQNLYSYTQSNVSKHLNMNDQRLKEQQNAIFLIQHYNKSHLNHNQLLEDFILGFIPFVNKVEEFHLLFNCLDIKDKNENLYLKTLIGKAALQKGFVEKEFLFPTPYEGLKLPTDKVLVYSIIKQESNFNKFAVSRSNAYGLMQVLAPTGREVCKKLRIKFDLDKLKTDPIYNIILGSHYIADKIKEFNGSYILGIASYNAGPTNVKKWIKKYQDPRLMNSLDKIINWIEMIPFPETRNYVMRVLENLHSYQNFVYQ